MLYWERQRKRMPDKKVDQMFCSIPKSPTTSFFQPVMIPAVEGQSDTRPWACPAVRPPRSRSRSVMVYLSALCLGLFVLVGVLMIIFLRV